MSITNRIKITSVEIKETIPYKLSYILGNLFVASQLATIAAIFLNENYDKRSITRILTLLKQNIGYAETRINYLDKKLDDAKYWRAKINEIKNLAENVITNPQFINVKNLHKEIQSLIKWIDQRLQHDLNRINIKKNYLRP